MTRIAGHVLDNVNICPVHDQDILVIFWTMQMFVWNITKIFVHVQDNENICPNMTRNLDPVPDIGTIPDNIIVPNCARAG